MLTDQDILAFASASLKKISDLELLLFLRAGRGQDWSVPELVRELRSSPAIIENALSQLTASGLVAETSPARYRLSPATPELEALLSALASMHRERPFKLITFIVEQASSPLQSFSDAFKLKD